MCIKMYGVGVRLQSITTTTTKRMGRYRGDRAVIENLERYPSRAKFFERLYWLVKAQCGSRATLIEDIVGAYIIMHWLCRLIWFNINTTDTHITHMSCAQNYWRYQYLNYVIVQQQQQQQQCSYQHKRQKQHTQIYTNI